MIKERLQNLRAILKCNNFDGYIISTSDEYLSEYSSSYAKRLEYITGFTGSNGLAIILQNTVLFFTDGRYLNQCSLQLEGELFQIFDLKHLHNFKWDKYIDSSEIIAYDPKLFRIKTLEYFSSIRLKSYHKNMIDEIWYNQPARPNSKIYNYPLKYAGEDSSSKIHKCRIILEQNNAEILLITDPASVCWLLNIRAHDVEFAPLLLANLIISKDQIFLFVDENRIDHNISIEKLNLLPENELSNFILNINGTILFDDSQCSGYISELIRPKKHKNIKNPCILWKACKNDIEINHIKDVHIRDAVAVCEMLSFIYMNDMSEMTEYDIGVKLTNFRKKNDGYVFDSFPTICGYQDNGAIIHYRADKHSAKKIKGSGLLLIDSGGQYFGATTDITRTISIGKPSEIHKKYYTKVLKGHIALSRAIFPKNNITGAHLDILARQYLWNDGDDYAHGTGHGVGSFLSVHEGPNNISIFSKNIIEKNMVFSNEPGYYSAGKFGIRIENMMYVKNSSNPDFLSFVTLTLVPYDKSLIEISMLTQDELEYLQSYYHRIKERLMPFLSDNAKNWLKIQKL